MGKRREKEKNEPKAIVIKNSPKPEPVFAIPAAATGPDIAAAVKALADAGLDAEVVPFESSASVADFRTKVEKFAKDAAADLAKWTRGQRFVWTERDVKIF